MNKKTRRFWVPGVLLANRKLTSCFPVTFLEDRFGVPSGNLRERFGENWPVRSAEKLGALGIGRAPSPYGKVDFTVAFGTFGDLASPAGLPRYSDAPWRPA